MAVLTLIILGLVLCTRMKWLYGRYSVDFGGDKEN